MKMLWISYEHCNVELLGHNLQICFQQIPLSPEVSSQDSPEGRTEINSTSTNDEVSSQDSPEGIEEINSASTNDEIKVIILRFMKLINEFDKELYQMIMCLSYYHVSYMS